MIGVFHYSCSHILSTSTNWSLKFLKSGEGSESCI